MTASASWYDHYPLTISSYSGILGLRQILMKNGQACNFAKKGTQSQIFFCEFYNFFRTALIQIICGWLLANLSIFTTEIPKKIHYIYIFVWGFFFAQEGKLLFKSHCGNYCRACRGKDFNMKLHSKRVVS